GGGGGGRLLVPGAEATAARAARAAAMLHGGGAAGPRAPPCAQIEVNAGPLTHLAASRKGPHLIVGGQQCLAALELVVSTPRSGEAAVPGFGFCVRQLRDNRRKQPSSAFGHGLKCTGVCFHPDGDVAASCSASGQVSLWDLSSACGKPEAQWQAHKQQVNAVAFVPAVPALVSAASDGTLHLTRIGDLLSARDRRKALEGNSSFGG
ncbi:unnamed protein product, partial [Prorocentrum cordatum]